MDTSKRGAPSRKAVPQSRLLARRPFLTQVRIGRAAAHAFAREGAKVVLAARGVDRGNAVAREIKEKGGDAIFVQTDVSKANQVESLIHKTVERYGRLGSVAEPDTSIVR